MMKILLGLVAIVVVAAGGFFGFELYAQYRIATEVDAAFAQIRAGGGKASHGAISFNLLKRTFTIADIATETAAQPPISVKIADVTASGFRQVDAAHVSADLIEVSDLEIAGTPFGGRRISYKAPRMTAKDFSGPIQAVLPPTSSSAIDVYRTLTAQFIDMSASSISAPSIAGTMMLDTPVHAAANFLYSGASFEGIRDGKIATAKVDDLKLTIDHQQMGRSEKLNGHLAGLTALDFDIKAMAALLDPKRADDSSLHQMYRQLAIGTYEFTAGQGLSMSIDGVTVDDVGVRPSRVQLENYLAALPQTDSEPTAAQARELMEKAAGLYEGAHVGNTDVRGISIETPEGPFKLAAIRLKLDDGKGDIALEGLDTRTPTGPFRMGRLALKSFDIAGIMRLSAQLAPPGQPPSPAQALAMLKLLEGVEVKGVSAPFKTTNKQVTIDTLSLNWGQFVGVIPTEVHLVAKMAAPVDAADPELQPLSVAGLDRLAVDLDLGAAWREASQSMALSPATVDIGNLLKASAAVTLAHVPRGVFSPELSQAMSVAPQIEAGALELNLHDAGALDLLVAQYARAHDQSREAARTAIIDTIKASGEQIASANPDGAAAVEAVTRFVETPGQTLVIKLAPLAKVPALQLLELLKTDPPAALAQFKIQVSTGL